jgi:hypothetical protein
MTRNTGYPKKPMNHVFHEVPIRDITVKSLVCKIVQSGFWLSVQHISALIFCRAHWSSEEEAEFTVTVLRLLFLGQHQSERLERSEDTHLFLSEELPLRMQYAIYKCYLIFTVERADIFNLRDIITTTYKIPKFSSAFRRTPDTPSRNPRIRGTQYL